MDQTVERIRERIVELLPRLRRMARTFVRERNDADDLVQITVERALLRVAQWRPDSPLENWLFGIMKNAWIDEVRSRTRRHHLFAPEEAAEHVGESSSEQQQQALSMQAAMGRLPEDQRLAVALVLVEGLSYKEAADILDVPMGTLTSRLARGRMTLMEMLSDGAGAVQ